MPYLQSLYEDYQNEVAFYFVARDQEEKIDAFMERHGYSFPVYFELVKAPARLESNSLPTTYIIDRSGSKIVDHTGAARWNSASTRQMIDLLIGSAETGSNPEKEEKISEE